MVVRFAPRRELMKSEGGAFSASSSEFWESPSRPVADLANDIVIGVEKRPEEAVGAVGAVGLFGTSSAAGKHVGAACSNSPRGHREKWTGP